MLTLSDQTDEAFHLICYILISLTQVSMLKTEQWFTKDHVNKKSKLLCHSYQTYEIFSWNTSMFIFLMQLSMLGNGSSC